MRNETNSMIVRLCLAALLGITAVSFVACGGGGTIETTHHQSDRINVLGAEGVLRSTTGVSPVGQTSELLERWTDLAIADDDVGIAEMVVSGKILLIQNETEIKVIDPGIFYAEVRIMSGTYFGQSGFVPVEFLQKRHVTPPDTTPTPNQIVPSSEPADVEPPPATDNEAPLPEADAVVHPKNSETLTSMPSIQASRINGNARLVLKSDSALITLSLPQAKQLAATLSTNGTPTKDSLPEPALLSSAAAPHVSQGTGPHDLIVIDAESIGPFVENLLRTVKRLDR